MNYRIKVVLGYILGRFSLNDCFYLRLLVKVFDIFFGVDQQQLFGGDEVVEEYDFFLMAFEGSSLLDSIEEI